MDYYKEITSLWEQAPESQKELIAKYFKEELSPTFKYRVNQTIIDIVLSFWRATVEQGTYIIDITKSDLHPRLRPSVTKARYHGLIAKDRDENGEHRANMWRLTHRGTEFLHGRLGIPEYVLVKLNKVVGHGEKTVWKNDFNNLKEFIPQYEIVGGRLVKADKINQTQMSFI